MGWFTCFDGVFARKATASETLPLYSDLYPAEQTQEAALPHAVYRFQRFLTWRLATDYGVASSIRKADRLCNPERTHFASLCQSYCTLLAAKFATEEQALQAKQQLMQDVFEPARLLGVPAGMHVALLQCFIITDRVAEQMLSSSSCSTLAFGSRLTATTNP